MEDYDDDDEEKFIRYADFYRKRLESKIDERLVFVDGESREPPPGLRSIRAGNIWRKATGSEAPPAWSVDDIVLALVVRAFGEPVEPVENSGAPMRDELDSFRCRQCRHYSHRHHEGGRTSGTCTYAGEAMSRHGNSRVCVAFERGPGERK